MNLVMYPTEIPEELNAGTGSSCRVAEKSISFDATVLSQLVELPTIDNYSTAVKVLPT